jgi:hypothetical protein
MRSMGISLLSVVRLMKAFSEASDAALLGTQTAQSRDSVFRSLLLTELLARPKLITETLVKLVLLSCPLMRDKLIVC